jgi:hypothetical protein
MKILSPVREVTGYWRSVLRSTGTFFLHRLVAECFVPKVPGKEQVNHIDGNPDNNQASNLEWLTPKENSRHAIETGLTPTGADHGNAVLTNEQVSMMRAMYDSGEWTLSALKKHFGVGRQTVTRAITGVTRYEASYPPLEINDEIARAAKSRAAREYWASTAEARSQIRAQRAATPRRRPVDRLTPQQVLDIRAALINEQPQQVADRLRLNLYSVMAIQAHRTYAWVTRLDSIAPKPGPKPRETKC